MDPTLHLRSLTGIRHATQQVREGDFDERPGWGPIGLEVELYPHRFTDADFVDSCEESLAELMTEIGRRPDLSNLRIVGGYDEDKEVSILPVKAVAAVVQEAIDLECLHLRGVCLVGSKEDFERFGNALPTAPLEVIALECSCRFKSLVESPAISPLNAVLERIAGMPSLSRLTLHGWDPYGSLEASAFYGLSQLQQLQFLEVNFPMSDEAVEEMAVQLRAKPGQLQELSLGDCPLKSTTCKRLGEVLLAIKHYQLSQLQINIRGIAENADPSLVLQDLASALESANCETLRLDIPESHFDMALSRLTPTVRSNYRVQRMAIYCYQGTPDEGLVLHDPDSDLYLDHSDDDELRYLSRANQLGRGQLFLNDDREDQAALGNIWLRVLDAADGDLSRIYDLVSEAPIDITRFFRQSCTQEDGKEEERGKVATFLSSVLLRELGDEKVSIGTLCSAYFCAGFGVFLQASGKSLSRPNESFGSNFALFFCGATYFLFRASLSKKQELWLVFFLRVVLMALLTLLACLTLSFSLECTQAKNEVVCREVRRGLRSIYS